MAAVFSRAQYVYSWHDMTQQEDITRFVRYIVSRLCIHKMTFRVEYKVYKLARKKHKKEKKRNPIQGIVHKVSMWIFYQTYTST